MTIARARDKAMRDGARDTMTARLHAARVVFATVVRSATPPRTCRHRPLACERRVSLRLDE
ncbi:hypothetical protein A8H35_20825 [Burkholderia thailandensis]|uniref:Uncharacterized protein n=1 Tax=Burkholderia thailandensis (strain ATCC 700388 / DSM 13276 / CCUG 48851 / CIP 106301 / E264) TaxID=271848 RepID=Q2T494_BURTA|nr:hypothetical protein BTH_II1811 [Burkholderia thailandensis E264]AOJ48647.1 hypothetical protein WJ27_26710 [Burkholderia thailandensis]AVR07877.1 hypothetical protein A8H31_10725 [Burkholderia thailandensis]AWY60776.1 hypothetical protein A8H35_20825 [Burkholderia thailandensis]AWY64829.1 hypothetical protein A8H36_05875 [Burkholderia thailandensis]